MMSPPDPSIGERLESWKEIAAFLNRGVRTVQRWERTEGLPVHRHMHDRQGTVWAYRHELEVWTNSRSEKFESVDVPEPVYPTAHSPRSFGWPVLAVFVAIAVAVPLAAWRLWIDADPDITLAHPIPFTSAPGFEQQPAFSPDGRYVVYTAGDLEKKNTDLFIQAVGNGQPEPFASSASYETSPAWSPNGESIAYLRSESGRPADLIVQPVVGGNALKVGEVHYHGQMAPVLAWSPDGEWLIASDKPAPDTPAGLFRVHAGTGERRRMTTCDGGCLNDSALASSSNHAALAFLRIDRKGNRGLWLLDLSESGAPSGSPRHITSANAALGPPTWLPGDQDIAFPLLTDFAWSWRRVHRAGHTLGTFDAFTGLSPRPVFSPNGEHLLAADVREDHDIRRVDLTTGEERNLIVSTRIDTNPQISPDGRWIVFPSSRRGNVDLWKTAADGSNPVQLFSVRGKSSGTPRWSPDGRKIAFDVSDSSASDIYTMNPDGGEVRKLTDHSARDFVPAWSPDGRWMYFGSERDDPPQIYKVPAEGGTAIRVTKNGGYGCWPSPDGKSLFITKATNKGPGLRSEPGLWRVDLNDGSEEPLTGVSTDWSRFAVRRDGIYFVARDVVRFLDFTSGEVRDVHKLDNPSAMGLSVAPDGKWLVYTAVSNRGLDLLMYRVHRR